MIPTLYRQTISRLLFVAGCLLIGITVIAQRYPVQIVPQLIAPYSLQISDYYNGSNEKLIVLLTNNDLNKPSLQVRLRMSIQGQAAKLVSRDNVYYPPIQLDAGLPNRISLSDLAPYFNADNLIFEGITRAQYVQNGKLPEGFYKFCFEAIEINSGQVVGSSSCAMAWISLSDPPLLNLPVKAENLVYKDPQNIIFQWTPRNYNSPTSAFNTEYEFTLVEVWDNGLAPEAAFGTAQPLYRTTTQATTLLYGPGEPLMLQGRRYAWRVRAQQANGSGASDVWRNNGYSEIYWFTCQNNCAAPLHVQHEMSGGRATITWAGSPNQTSYTVDYREKNQSASTWYSTPTTAGRMMLYDLKKDKIYEYRVGGTCDNGTTYTYSGIKTLVMESRNNDAGTGCGILIPGETIANRTPVQTLLNGDVITAGDFPVKLLQVSGQGTFTGAGYVTVPFIGQNRVKVKFTGITVNTDKQLIGGVIESTYDPREGQIANLDKLIEGGDNVGIVVKGVDTTGYYVDMVIPGTSHIKVDLNDNTQTDNPVNKGNPANNNKTNGGATVTITGSDGTVKEVKVKDLPATIKDKSGTIYGIDNKGNVTQIGQSGSLNMTAAKLNNLQTGKAVVSFTAHEKQRYAFDEYQPLYSKSNLFGNEYEKLNGDYHVSAKAIVEAQTDVVKAVVQIKDNSIKADSIQFITGKGTRYQSRLLVANTWEVHIVGGPGGDAQELYAVYPQGGGKYLSLGKLLITSFKSQTRKLVLVPVDGASADKDKISKELNAIYNPVGISFEVMQEESFNDQSWDLNKDGKLAVSGSGWLSNLTDEMKALNGAYKTGRSIKSDAVYLFVLKSSDSTIAGDMPRGKQFGYLFTGSDGKVAAHEVGHGLFKLKHVFDGFGFNQGQLPSNVMDYPCGDRFTLYQWKQLHDPGVVIGVFEKDGDRQSVYLKQSGFDVNLSTPGDYYQPAANERVFMSPGGKLVVFKADASLKNLHFKMCEKDGPAFYPLGCLLEFTLDDIPYSSMYITKDNLFCHYSKKENIEKYRNATTKDDNLLDKYTFNYTGLVNGQEYNAHVLFQHPDEYGKVLKSVVPIKHDGQVSDRANDIKNGSIYVVDIKTRPEATMLEMKLASSCTSSYDKLLDSLLDDVGEFTYPGAKEFVQVHSTNDIQRTKIVKNIGYYINKIGDAIYTQLKEGESTIAFSEGGNRVYLNYLAYLKRFWQMLEKTGTDASKITYPNLLVDYYWEKYKQFKSLDEYTRAWKIEDRLKVLNVLANNNMSGGGKFFAYMIKEANWWNTGYGMEEFAVSIIANTPNEDRDALLTGLLKDNLLYNLIDKIDNAGFGENNYDRLFTHIIEFGKEKLNAEKVDRAELVNKKRVFLWKTQFFTNQPSFKAELLENGKVKVTTGSIGVDVVDAAVQFVKEGAKTVPGGGLPAAFKTKEISVELDPFTPVLLVLGEAPANSIASLQSQSLAVVPAVALDWLWRTNHTRIWKQWGKRSLDVGLTALSAGAWTAVNKTGKAIIVANAAFTAGDFLLSESHIKESLMQSVAGKRFLTVYYAMMAVTAVADLATAMTGLQRNADEFVNAFEEASALRNADGSPVITAGSDIEKRSKGLYEELRRLGYGSVADKLADIQNTVNAAIQKIGNLYDKNKITLQAIREENLIKLRQLGIDGEFYLMNIDKVGKIVYEEAINWLRITKMKYFGSEYSFALDLNGYYFAKATETGSDGKAIERIRAIPGNPQNIRSSIEVIKRELNIADGLFQNTYFKSILQKFESKGVTGVEEARSFMEEIKRLNLEDLLRADLDGSRAGDLSGLLENPADLAIYKQIKDDPYSAAKIVEEGLPGVANKDRWDKWAKSEFFKAIRQKGKEFEDYMTGLIAAKDPDIWADLQKAIPDLKDRKILTQIHFCVPGKVVPCNKAGEYFIADFVFVKYGKDSKGKPVIEDMIIGECKLSAGTTLRYGQKAAKAAVGKKLSIRSSKINTDIKQEVIPVAFVKGSEVKQTQFIEIRGNGNGAYEKGGVK